MSAGSLRFPTVLNRGRGRSCKIFISTFPQPFGVHGGIESQLLVPRVSFAGLLIAPAHTHSAPFPYVVTNGLNRGAQLKL